MDKRSQIKVTADTDPAKASFNELNDLIIQAQHNIDKAFNSAQSNNGFITNRQMAGAQNGIGRLNDIKNAMQQALDEARANQTPSQLGQTESTIAPKLDRITQALQQLQNQNARQWGTINNANTTSSRAFNQGYVYNPTNASQVEDNLNQRNFRSNVHNFSNTIDKVSRNYDIAQRTGYISYNRYQEYKASVESLNQRYAQFQDRLAYIDQFNNRFKATQQEAQRAETKAQSSDATSADVRWARELDEQVKAMSKLNAQYEQQSNQLKESKSKLEDLESAVESPDKNTRIGYNPNSLKGFLYGRRFIMGRLAAASMYNGVASSISQGDSIRLNSFDDIKSIAYANGGRDNLTLRTLGNSGYRWGYAPDQMAQFAGAYTSSTGNVGSIRDVDRVASAWARQSRVTGGNAQSTLALETSAGNAVNMNSSQMSRLGNSITNSIINSGMNAKATQQQQGLAMLYDNGARYGMTASDERNMAGFQASLSKYGSNMQGTQGAQAIMGMASTLGNYNNPAMRQLFAMNNPGRYMGIRGNARMLEDMQNLQKQPWKMRRVLMNATRAYGGDKLVAAANISEASGGSVTVDQAKKMITAAQNGDMSQKQFENYVKKTTRSGKGANKLYSKTGTSTLQKYNAALANSAMKASQSIDLMRKAISGLIEHSGPFGGAASGFLNAAGSVGGSVLGMWGMRKIGRMFGGRVAEDVAKDTAKEATKGGRFSKLLRGGSMLFSKEGRHNLGKRANGKLTDLAGRFLNHDLGKGIFKRGGKALGIGTLLNGGFAVSDFAHGNLGNGLLDILGMIPGIGSIADIAQMGGLGDKLTNKLKHMSVKDATRAARKHNRRYKSSLSDAENLSEATGGRMSFKEARDFIRRHPKSWRTALAGGALAGGAYLANKDNESHADTVARNHKKRARKRKNATSQNEDWKLLRGYNKMLDHAMRVVQAAKSIKAGGGDNSKSDDDGDISGTGGKGDKAIRSIAKAVAKKTGMDAKNIYAQLALESADGSSEVSQKDNNFAGIKFANQPGATSGSPSPEGDNYAHFKDTDAFANAYAKILEADGLHGGMSIDDWAQQLKNRGYYTASEASYAAGLKSWADKWATGGVTARRFAAGAGMIASQPTYGGPGDVFGEAGTEAYVPLNAGHYGSGLSALKDLAGLFGKQVVDQSAISSNKSTTINPSYNINLTINGGTDNPDSLAQKVADKVRAMLNEYDQQQANSNRMFYYGNETSSQFM